MANKSRSLIMFSFKSLYVWNALSATEKTRDWNDGTSLVHGAKAVGWNVNFSFFRNGIQPKHVKLEAIFL